MNGVPSRILVSCGLIGKDGDMGRGEGTLLLAFGLGKVCGLGRSNIIFEDMAWEWLIYDGNYGAAGKGLRPRSRSPCLWIFLMFWVCAVDGARSA